MPNDGILIRALGKKLDYIHMNGAGKKTFKGKDKI